MLVSVSTTSNPPLPMPSRVPGSQNASRRRAQPPRHSTTDALEQWVRTRLKKEPTAEIPAREAYADFCRWTRARGLIGRELTARINRLGGRKAKRRDRAYYVGVSLIDGTTPIGLKAAA
jgi:hypothetical protein